jgi:hypothetical protein
MKQSGPILRQYRGIFLEGLWKSRKSCQDSRYPAPKILSGKIQSTSKKHNLFYYCSVDTFFFCIISISFGLIGHPQVQLLYLPFSSASPPYTGLRSQNGSAWRKSFSELCLVVLVRSSETSVHTRTTRRHIPANAILRSHRRENLLAMWVLVQVFRTNFVFI